MPPDKDLSKPASQKTNLGKKGPRNSSVSSAEDTNLREQLAKFQNQLTQAEAKSTVQSSTIHRLQDELKALKATKQSPPSQSESTLKDELVLKNRKISELEKSNKVLRGANTQEKDNLSKTQKALKAAVDNEAATRKDNENLAAELEIARLELEQQNPSRDRDSRAEDELAAAATANNTTMEQRNRELVTELASVQRDLRVQTQALQDAENRHVVELVEALAAPRTATDHDTVLVAEIRLDPETQQQPPTDSDADSQVKPPTAQQAKETANNDEQEQIRDLTAQLADAQAQTFAAQSSADSMQERITLLEAQLAAPPLHGDYQQDGAMAAEPHDTDLSQALSPVGLSEPPNKTCGDETTLRKQLQEAKRERDTLLIKHRDAVDAQDFQSVSDLMYETIPNLDKHIEELENRGAQRDVHSTEQPDATQSGILPANEQTITDHSGRLAPRDDASGSQNVPVAPPTDPQTGGPQHDSPSIVGTAPISTDTNPEPTSFSDTNKQPYTSVSLLKAQLHYAKATQKAAVNETRLLTDDIIELRAELARYKKFEFDVYHEFANANERYSALERELIKTKNQIDQREQEYADAIRGIINDLETTGESKKAHDHRERRHKKSASARKTKKPIKSPLEISARRNRRLRDTIREKDQELADLRITYGNKWARVLDDVCTKESEIRQLKRQLHIPGSRTDSDALIGAVEPPPFSEHELRVQALLSDKDEQIKALKIKAGLLRFDTSAKDQEITALSTQKKDLEDLKTRAAKVRFELDMIRQKNIGGKNAERRIST